MRTADYIELKENQEEHNSHDDDACRLQLNGMRSPSNSSEKSIPARSQTSTSKGKKGRIECSGSSILNFVLIQI